MYEEKGEHWIVDVMDGPSVVESLELQGKAELVSKGLLRAWDGGGKALGGDGGNGCGCGDLVQLVGGGGGKTPKRPDNPKGPDGIDGQQALNWGRDMCCKVRTAAPIGPHHFGKPPLRKTR